VKIIEKTFSNQTFYTLIPKNKYLDFKEVFAKIKKKKTQAFHNVFLTVPLEIAYECNKALKDEDLSTKNIQANKHFVVMEIR
jgi:hypothetical protein